MKMSPLLPLSPWALLMVVLVVPRLSLRVAPVISPPEAATVKSCVGSIAHAPVLPYVARVSIFAPSAILTAAPEVSTEPPSPLSGAEASSVPLTAVVPTLISESSTIFPALFSSVRARTMPVLFTAALVRSLAACALITAMPPSA